MERFSINIDNAVKARLYELCRLCGMDNQQKIKILDQNAWLYGDGEIELRRKIFECVGVQVRMKKKGIFLRTRRMPIAAKGPA